ncbi:MAG TPA: multiheme c-type cytochrome [bacterium]|nr:multiheme c-type cytochrome [bacterium]HPN43260.1 multiheme c-type cytochrome [bacterium]
MTIKRIILLVLVLAGASFSQVITSAQECKDCHSVIFNHWQKSRHALSTTERSQIYRAMFSETDQASRAACQKCHEPLTSPGFADLTGPRLRQEGITCDFCHATELTGSGSNTWFKVLPGNVKTGPYKDAIPTAHGFKYSADLGKSSFCLTCHKNDDNPHGITFINLEKEWKKSSYHKLNITCQDCHMPAISGITAELGKLRDETYNHQFYGGFNSEILTDCIKLDLQADKTGNDYYLTVKISNRTAGHGIPGASPLRMIILNIDAKDELKQTVWKNYYNNPLKEDPQGVFMKLFEDQNGRAPALFWKAAGERFDSRLMPDEERVLKYTLQNIPAKTIQATVVYYIAPPPLLRELNITGSSYIKTKTITTASITLP